MNHVMKTIYSWKLVNIINCSTDIIWCRMPEQLSMTAQEMGGKSAMRAVAAFRVETGDGARSDVSEASM